ncbi:MAG: hypothetical protein K6E55_07175 [Thermoguttaceae bacterium]|nr:hypothetical protein [Thermoguttaceae bacterium]
MYSKIWVTFEGVVVGLAFYFLYAALFVPTFVMPRAARQRVSMPRPAVNTSSEVERMSRENSELLAEVFPDADDWRRIHPLSVIPKDRSWILLFPNEPRPEDGVITFDSCTFVKPSAEKNLSEKERFRRAIVVETADKVELRFNARLGLQALTGGLSPNNFERGQFFGQVTVRSVMDPDDPNDDFHLTTRNISFSLEQITTDSEVIAHYGNRQVEGVGLRVNINMPLQKRETPAPPDEDPLADVYENGNLGFGFSIRDVSLDKLTRLEFEVPDYLAKVPDANPWDGTPSADPEPEPEPAAEDEAEKTVKVDIRCRDRIYFAPNVTDAPSVWCARLSGNVEITALSEERQPDSLRCDILYLYLNDPELQKRWEESSALYKGRRKPTGTFSQLVPYQIRAIGSRERKSSLRMESVQFNAEGGEILYEFDRQRVSIQPLESPAAASGTDAAAPEEDQVALQYGKASVVSERIEFAYGKETFGELTAFKKGRLETELPTETPGVEPDRLTVTWNDVIRVAPSPDETDIYIASFRGGIRAESKQFGVLTAEKGDFWFKAHRKQEGEISDGTEPKVKPQSARLSGNVEMTSPRGRCTIRSDVEFVFDQTSFGGTGGGAKTAGAGTPGAADRKSGPFEAGSMMGGDGDSTYDLSAERMKIWLTARPKGGTEVSRIRIAERVLLTETDRIEQKETLRIDGSDITIDNPGSRRVAVHLRGRPANFVGSGLNLSGDDVHLSRADNSFSVKGPGQLRFAVPKKSSVASLGGGSAADEPVEVWWPEEMSFDGKALVFRGKTQPQEGAGERPKDNELVNVRQGNSLELKSSLISLKLKQPIQIFDFDMGKDASGAKKLPLDKMACRGTPSAPVSVAWFGVIAPDADSQSAAAGGKRPLRGRGRGEAASVELTVDTGDLTASGPGWFRGTVETPKSDAGPADGGAAPMNQNIMSMAQKPWTHFHLVFHDRIDGNIRTRNASVEGDVRLAVVGSEKSELDLDVNGVAQLPADTFVLSCRTLRFGEAVSPGDSEGHMEVAALGDARFEYKTLNFDSKDRGKGEAEPTPAAHSKYQTFTGNADVLKYDHRKRTVIMQGNGLSPAKLYRQERAGAPINTQTFNIASFNLDSQDLDLSLSGTGFSAGDLPGIFPGK